MKLLEILDNSKYTCGLPAFNYTRRVSGWAEISDKDFATGSIPVACTKPHGAISYESVL
jgi:hypothetical protein